ncbi:ParB N-terminal domain-containing protein [Candidatus Kaiserbacteria bacterium]|nr:ParB N-terminal domain-containing protein [Candidatus Kaiserbacteria bacterium]
MHIMKIELVPIEKVIPYARNPRKNKSTISKVAASIKEYGFRQPIVVDENMVVIVGHARLEASYNLDLNHVPVHIATGLTSAQIKAYRIADNRTHEDSSWNDELLTIELGELYEDKFDLSLTGFEEIEWERLLAEPEKEGLVDDDDVPQAPEQPVTKRGDIWILGKHRLICEDSTSPHAIEQLLDGRLADMVFTDPPYNINYKGSVTDREKGQKRIIQNDNLGGLFGKFLYDVCHNMLSVSKGAIYICMSSSELHTLYDAFTQAGGKWSTFIIWVKNHFNLGQSDYQRQYEAILYGWQNGSKHYWCGDRNQSDTWFYDKPISNDLHPTMKPVDLVAKAIKNSSRSKDIVLDPFGGSGSTLIACEKLHREARLVEIDEKFCDVIIRRWQDYTGEDAILSSTGQTYMKLASAEKRKG